MKILTVDALWAWAIIVGHKPVENRTWFTKYRGLLGIHAGKTRTRDAETFDALRGLGVSPPRGDDLEALRGKVLGTVKLIDIVDLGYYDANPEDLERCGPYAIGPYCWLLADPHRYQNPVAAVGRLGLWTRP